MVIFHSYVSLPEGRFYPVAKRGISQQRRGWFSYKTVMILAAWASGPSKIGHNHATIQILSPKSSHHHIPHHIFDDMMGWCTIRWFRTYIYHKTRCDIQQYHDLLSCNQAWHYIEHHMKKSQHIFAMDFDDFPHFPSPQCGISPSHPRCVQGTGTSCPKMMFSETERMWSVCGALKKLGGLFPAEGGGSCGEMVVGIVKTC